MLSVNIANIHQARYNVHVFVIYIPSISRISNSGLNIWLALSQSTMVIGGRGFGCCGVPRCGVPRCGVPGLGMPGCCLPGCGCPGCGWPGTGLPGWLVPVWWYLGCQLGRWPGRVWVLGNDWTGRCAGCAGWTGATGLANFGAGVTGVCTLYELPSIAESIIWRTESIHVTDNE